MIGAAGQGATECVALLLEKFAYVLDVNAQQDDGTTALGMAAYHGYRQMVSLLLRAGADPTIHDNEGWIALDTAQAQGHQHCVALLEVPAPPCSVQGPPTRGLHFGTLDAGVTAAIDDEFGLAPWPAPVAVAGGMLT